MKDDLARDYESAGLGSRLGFGRKPALILIDFLAGYYAPESPLYNAESVRLPQAALRSALRIREAARKAGVPVILTSMRYTETEIALMQMFRKTPSASLFREGSTMADFASGLTPFDDEIVIVKRFPSALFDTNLVPLLASRSVDSLIITGLTTSGCIRATALDALCHGLIPLVVEQAVGDRHIEPHRANLFDMRSKMADVVSEADILDHLLMINAAMR